MEKGTFDMYILVMSNRVALTANKTPYQGHFLL